MASYEYLLESPRLAVEASHTAHDALSEKEEAHLAIHLALRWLETLTKSPALAWNPEQKAAAIEAHREAKAALTLL